MTGIPLLGGFISKLYLANAAMDLGGRRMVLALLALAASAAHSESSPSRMVSKAINSRSSP